MDNYEGKIHNGYPIKIFLHILSFQNMLSNFLFFLKKNHDFFTEGGSTVDTPLNINQI